MAKNQVVAPLGGGAVSGTSSGDQISGSGASDDIETGSGRNKVIAANGDDTIVGGSNRDNLVGNNGNDRIEGRASNDTLNGRNGNDFLDGGAGNDKLYGGNDSDYLRGGDGNDKLFGADRSNGDAVTDYFAFDKADGHDTVFNFEIGVDRIYLEEGGNASLSYNAKTGNTTMTYDSTVVTFKGVDLTHVDMANLYATDSEIDAFGTAHYGNPDFNM